MKIPPSLSYRKGRLYCEGVSVRELAEQFGTPLYFYSESTLLGNLRRIQKAFSPLRPLVAFSVKANSNGALLRLLRKNGAGFDIVSGGELQRVLGAGSSPDKIIFAGVGKTREEMRAALRARILMFNVESLAEARALSEEARKLRLTAPVALRVNPDVDAGTHEYITTGRKENKFGVSLDRARGELEALLELPHLRLVGLHAHIGSQILNSRAYVRAFRKVEKLITFLRGRNVRLESLNLGGGFGICYEENQKPLNIEKVAAELTPLVKPLGLRFILEPGRSVVGPAGFFLVRVLYIKEAVTKTFVITDGAMNDLIRPSLYSAYHRIIPEREPTARKMKKVDVVGPVCESGDFFAKDRPLPPAEAEDLLVIADAGAYGFAMASNYNTRPRSAEALIKGKGAELIRQRETVKELLANEVIPERLA